MKTASDAAPAAPDDPAATVGKRRLRQIPEADAGWWEAVHAYGPNHPALVSTAAIAEALGRSPATVRWWRWKGAFPAPVIVRGRLRHLRDDVQAWALGRRRRPARRRQPPEIVHE